MINNREREYLKYTLAQEKQVLNSLKDIYKKALKEINVKIAYLEARNSVESTTSIIYQLNYQQALKKQIDGILDNLSGKQYEKIQDYLIDCYDNGFVGTMYDLHGQGVPLILPIDQEQVLNALTTNSKLSKPLYDRLGEDIKKLKSTIRHEISRGIASAMSYADIARNIANVSKTGINNAFRIARTEGHRIQNESAFDAMNKAKDKGADVVKQWDATLDGRTRKTHRELDGKIVEVNEPFIFNGHKAMYPGGFGVANLDINCRCAVLTRAKWALDEESDSTKWDNANGKLIKIDSDNYEEFKEKYFKINTINSIIDLDKYKDYAFEDFKVEEKDYLGRNKDVKLVDVENGYVGSSGSWEINHFLRTGKWSSTLNKLKVEKLENIIPSLNSLINNTVSLNDAKLVRFDSLNLLKSLNIDLYNKSCHDIAKEIKAKKQLTWKGFMSCSTDENKNVFTSKALRFNIYCDKGTKMYKTLNPDESEVILPNLSVFDILDAIYDETTNKFIVTLKTRRG